VPPSAPAARRLLRELLEDAVAKQMAADVPVGVFTSGGVDSSLIAALASRIAGYRVHTFTASFTNRKYDEGVYARRLSRDVGTEHIEIRIGEDELEDALHTVVPRMAEPLADPALLPTYLLARTAKDYVGVVLTGEGADELFGGYPTYLGHRVARAYASLPRAVRGAIETLTSKVAATQSPVPLSLVMKRFTTHAHADWLERHIGWFGTGLFPYLPKEAQESFRESLPEITARDPVRAAMEFDYITYLRDGLLVKLDRAGMLVSLESRAPFLDSRVIGFARGLPPDFIIRGLRTKRLLKEAAATLVPGWTLRRRKRGLSVPIAAWINNGLRSEVDRLLDPARLRDQGVLPALPIDELLSDHRTGRANHARALWPLVVLQYWLEHWVPGGET
jgi:asparagine synthase (glutamine-hydrolysing)